MERRRVIIFTLYDTEGSSSRFRIYQYLDSIRAYADIKVCRFWPNSYIQKYMKNKKRYIFQIAFLYIHNSIKRLFQLLFQTTKYDCIIIQKTCIPKIRLDFLYFAKKKGIPILFDVDDAVFLDTHDCSDRIARDASIIFCGSQFLLDHYSRLNKNIFLVPTVDEPTQYLPYIHDTFENKTIGWIGNVINLSNLDIVIEPINHIIERHPEVSFNIISSDDGGYVKKIKNCNFINWNPSLYLKDLSNFTVGIMPLYDNEMNRGKCSFKIIQYLTMCKPVVGSPVGGNATVISNNGYVADNSHEWEECLESILFDKSDYYRMVSNIQNNFLNQYSFRNNCEMFKSFIFQDHIIVNGKD